MFRGGNTDGTVIQVPRIEGEIVGQSFEDGVDGEAKKERSQRVSLLYSCGAEQAV